MEVLEPGTNRDGPYKKSVEDVDHLRMSWKSWVEPVWERTYGLDRQEGLDLRVRGNNERQADNERSTDLQPGVECDSIES